jgi:hypothetical protein
MNSKIAAEKTPASRAPRRATKEPKSIGFAAAAVAQPASLIGYGTCRIAEVPKRRKKARRAARAKEPQPTFVAPSFRIEPQPSLLGRALSWLRSASAAPKQLRVEDTVSLGEKRFVAILHAEGRKFLIGGGTEGVSLLKQLDETP